MDNCCREYIFITDFFMVQESDAQKLFNTVLGKSLSHIQVIEDFFGVSYTKYIYIVFKFKNGLYL